MEVRWCDPVCFTTRGGNQFPSVLLLLTPIHVVMPRAATGTNGKAAFSACRACSVFIWRVRGARARAMDERGHLDVGRDAALLAHEPVGAQRAIRLLDAVAKNRGGIREATGTSG